jgi:hypothetical protein
MESNLNKQDRFLVEEYKTAVKLTYHIDRLRNNLTKFFLIFGGVAVGGVTILLRGEGKHSFFGKATVIGSLLFVVSLMGILIVAVLARLRKVQIEHFHIINNIRKYFIRDDSTLSDVVVLSDRTLPSPNRYSGTYIWLCMIMVLNSVIFTLSLCLIVVDFDKLLCPPLAFLGAFAIFLLFIVAQDYIYFRLVSS